MQYRRDYITGATYFFTVVTFRRSRLFNQPEAVARLRAAFSGEMAWRPFYIDAIVIMPEHIHAIWTLSPDDADYSIRWRNIKRSFTAAMPPEQRPAVFASRQRKHEQAIWQRRFLRHAQDKFGNTVSGMKGILTSILITSITIRLSMAPLFAPLIGRTVVFTGTFGMGLSAPIGAAVPSFYPIVSAANNVAWIKAMRVGCGWRQPTQQ